MDALVRRNMVLQCLETYEIRSINGIIPVYVSCKFEMYIFKITLVINKTVRFAFLYALSMCVAIMSSYVNETQYM